jgi:DNA polymerase bacteriophage-type
MPGGEAAAVAIWSHGLCQKFMERLARISSGGAVLKILFLDTETRSRLDISVGTDRYTRAAECRIVTYAFATGPAKIWLPYKEPIPRDLKDALDDPEFLLLAHNSAFDRLILQRALKITTGVARWRCTMAGASAHGLPGSLEALGSVCMLTADEGKLMDDKGLIQTFCTPQPATGKFIEPHEAPEEWARFCAYAIRDTEALRAIFNRMPQVNYAGVNLRSWMLDQLINERGFGFDVRLAQAASEFLDDAREASRKVMRENTDNQIGSATQAKRLLAYIRNRYGIDIDSLKAGDVRDYLESDDLDPILRTVLEERLEAGKSAGTKFKRGLVLVGPEDRIRHWSRWSGAGRTGRHAARGYQPHNMARPAITVRRPPGHKRAGRIELDPVKADVIDSVIIPGIYSKAALNNPLVYGGPFESVAIAVRHGIIAAQGNELVVADFKNVETVITAWVAGEESVLNAFRDLFENPKDKSKDPYRIIAGRMLGKPPEEVNESERQMGKVCILAFGFGGGVAALVNMAIAYQMDLEPLASVVLPTATPEQLEKANKAWERAFLTGEDFELERDVYMACDIMKQAFRTANPAINQMRYDLNTAILEAVADKNGTVYHVGRCAIWCNASFLVIELPSGRRLLYAAPILKQEEVEDPLGGKSWKSRYVTYLTVRGRSWRRERAWSGLFVENIVQGTANDVLRAAMLRVHDDTLTVPAIAEYLTTLEPYARTAISLHVHDEIGIDVPKDSYSEERLLAVMKVKEPWMGGLPIAADLWTNPRYGKR